MTTFPERTLDIATADAAANAVRQLAAAPELAVDIEADAMHAFRARLCFLQIGSDSDVFLFDTLSAEVQVAPLVPLFADAARTKVFHAAGGDLQYLAEQGARVKGLFDTHRAATLLGWQKVGLADLARELLGIELAKEHQQSDFSIRPLPPEMRDYIANDVRYLLEIGRRVRQACVEADILEEVLLDCDRLCDESAARPEVAPFRPKLPRGQLKPPELARAQALAAALHERRLFWAETANVPMGRMLSNAAITDIVLKVPENLKALARSQGVRGAFVREHGTEVLALIRDLSERAARGELQPETTTPRNPRSRRLEDALRAWRTAEATQRKVTPSVVMSNATLETLGETAPQSLEQLAALPYFGTKRLARYGAQLLEVLKKT